MCCCCPKCVTRPLLIILFAVNAFFTVSGLSILIMGAVYTSKYNDIAAALPDESIQGFTVSSICVGIGIVLAAIFGICGAWRGNKLFLIIYLIIVGVLLSLQLSIGITALQKAHDDNLETSVTNQLTAAIAKAETDGGETQKAMDNIQNSLHCCGSTSYTDWNTLPASCCSSPPCNKNDNGHYTPACGKELYTSMHDSLQSIGITAIILSLIQVASAIIFCMLCCTL